MVDNKLVLLFGMPRSGTTWIGKLLDSSQHTYYLHEPDSAQPKNNIPLIAKNHDAPLLEQSVREWLASKDEKVIASRPFFRKSYMSFLDHQIFLTSSYLTKLSLKVGFPGLSPIRHQQQPQLTVWKSIESLGRMPLIQKLTNADSIHLLRHPCGHIASTLRGESSKKFSGTIPIYDDLPLFELLLKQGDCDLFDINDIKNMSDIERLAVRWGIVNDSALQADYGDGVAITLKYEDVCGAPLKKIQGVYEKLAIPFEQQTQNFIEYSTSKNSDSYYDTQKDPMISANKWQTQLTESQQQSIKNVVSQFDVAKYYADDF
ncbi:sulfotransferase [Thalassotalea maritima]|uniref:sulfotransferase n=1 Tax=Thalassotalea maritima TaxID=3242416 RepID=UPI003527A9B9